MSRELNTSESDGSNVGDSGYEHDSWLTNQDDVVDEAKQKFPEEMSPTDRKTQEQGGRAPVSNE